MNSIWTSLPEIWCPVQLQVKLDSTFKSTSIAWVGVLIENVAGKGGLGFAVYQPAVERHPQLFKGILVAVGVGHEPTKPIVPLQICTRGVSYGSRAILRTKHTYA